MAIVGVLTVVMGVNTAPLTAGLASASAQLKGFSGVAGATFAAVRTAAVGLGLAVGGGAALGIKAAADFQDAFAGVRKTVNEADLTKVGLSFDILAQQFRDMATTIPVAANELAAIGETAGALGIAAQDIEEFTRTVALLGVTTDLTTDVAAEALGKIGTILGFAGQDYLDFADILVNLGNQGASVESEIIEVTKRFAAQGKQAGLTTAEITALASVSTSLGALPEAAGSSLSRIFSNMATEIALSSKKGIAFAQVTAGVFDELEALAPMGGKSESRLWGPLDVIGDEELARLQAAVESGESLPEFLKFLTELNKLGPLDQAKALKGAGISNVLSRNAIISMAQNLPEVIRQLDVATRSTGALGIEAAKRFDTFNAQVSLLGNNFNELLITIGTPLLPPLTEFVGSVTAAIQSVSAWVASGATISSTFTPIIDTIVSRFTQLWTIAQQVGVVVMDLASRVWEGGLNRVLGTAATLVGSVIDVLGGIATAIMANQDAMNILRTAADLIGAGFGIVADAVGKTLDFLGQLGDNIRNNQAAMAALATVGDIIAVAFTTVRDVLATVIDHLTKIIDLAAAALASLTGIGGTPPTGTGPGGRIGPRPYSGKTGLDPIGSTLEVGGAILGTIGDIIGGVGDLIPWKKPMEYAHGGMVPGIGPQLAIVHGGETVTPPGQGGSSGGGGTLILQVDGHEMYRITDERLAVRESLVTVRAPGRF